MAITILCPTLKCRMLLAVPDEIRGKKVRCKYCGTTFIVPAKGVPVPTPRAPEPTADPAATTGK